MNLPDFLYEDGDREIRLKGHRLRIIDVAARFDEGHSAEGIAFDIYPTLELPLVYKAIAFFLENETEIRETMARHAAEVAQQAALPQTTPGLQELRRRMNAKRPAEAS
jgi:uncharacterized protein (DUF433 family)